MFHVICAALLAIVAALGIGIFRDWRVLHWYKVNKRRYLKKIGEERRYETMGK